MLRLGYKAYLGMGSTHLVFHFSGQDQERAITRYAQEILPRMRRRFGGWG